MRNDSLHAVDDNPAVVVEIGTRDPHSVDKDPGGVNGGIGDRGRGNGDASIGNQRLQPHVGWEPAEAAEWEQAADNVLAEEERDGARGARMHRVIGGSEDGGRRCPIMDRGNGHGKLLEAKIGEDSAEVRRRRLDRRRAEGILIRWCFER